MVSTSSGGDILGRLASENPGVRRSLKRLQHKSLGSTKRISGREITDRDGLLSVMMPYCCCRASIVSVGVTMLVMGLVLLYVLLGGQLHRLLMAYWKGVLIGLAGACLGGGAILIVREVGRKPLRNIAPPDDSTDEPLRELEALAARTVSRLRTAYRIQICLSGLVGLVVVGVIGWAVVMVTQERLLYATAFGAGGVGMVALSKWKWQPFERVAEARRLADKADALATGLRLRMESISKIDDPKERAKAQWDAVRQYLRDL